MICIKKAAVIGSGVMGSGIAAHLANAGLDVLLLDIVPLGTVKPQDRNALVAKGLESIKTAKPPHLMRRKAIESITIGNLEDDISKLADCDLIIEVVLEKMEVKQALFEKIEAHRMPGAIVASNTSGLSIENMLEGRGVAFKENFLVMHFFNPVRYLHLLEMVPSKEMKPGLFDSMVQFGEDRLGKGVVFGKDTPNFVANRIGVFYMMDVMQKMHVFNMTVPEVDAIFGPFLGRPKSAVFRTADVVGLDTFMHVAKNCFDSLPDDECREVFVAPDFLGQMVEQRKLGQKTGEGFYKKEAKNILTLNLSSFTYEPASKPELPAVEQSKRNPVLEDRMKEFLGNDARESRFAFAVLASTLAYSARRLFEIADDIVQIDNALKWGFGWEMGPFETWDALGVEETLSRMKQEKIAVPDFVQEMLNAGESHFFSINEKGQRTYWCPKENARKVVLVTEKNLTLGLIKTVSSKIIADGKSSSLVDLGDGILACEFHTKMNAVNGNIIADINRSLDMCESGQFKALIIANDGQHFSAGADLSMVSQAIERGDFDAIKHLVLGFQEVGKRLKYSAVPTVVAPFQMTLGGGLELSMWCSKIRAHSESYMGLVEVGVGLIPGGGGHAQLLARILESAASENILPIESAIQKAFEQIAFAKVSSSAQHARELSFLRSKDSITFNRNHLLWAAKQDALHLVETGKQVVTKPSFALPGRALSEQISAKIEQMVQAKKASSHDALVASKVADILCGGEPNPGELVGEDRILELELEAFLSLCGEQKTKDRIDHMLKTGKPLRN